ncbi:MAG: sugar ABC transporter permease [Clostridia bacterium]|nr:sugar ABC transporter permease [Clostridia bacterium]
MKERTKAKIKKYFERYNDYPKPLRKGKYIFVFCMLILTIVRWAVFYVAVNFESIVMAFREFTGYGPNNEAIYRWSFANFEKFWSEMSYTGWATQSFKAALKNTLFLFFAGNAVTIPTTYLVSYYLYKKMPGTSGFIWILYLPSVLSSVVMVTIFKNIVDANGLISAISIALGRGAITDLLISEDTAKWMVWCYNTWMGFPGAYVLVTAAMRRIPEEIIESAKLDGVTPRTEFFKIIFPLIWPTVQVLLLQKITALLSADGPILLLTGGKADTYTIGYWYYDQVILSHSYEYPSAVGLIMTLFVAPLALLVKKLTDKVEAY